MCETCRSNLRPLCEINLHRNLASLARHHPALVRFGFSIQWSFLRRSILWSLCWHFVRHHTQGTALLGCIICTYTEDTLLWFSGNRLTVSATWRQGGRMLECFAAHSVLGGSSCMVKMRQKLPLHGTAKK